MKLNYGQKLDGHGMKQNGTGMYSQVKMYCTGIGVKTMDGQ
jgi:hypothetical protein